VEEAWNFFSSPRNLAVITPPEMGFVIREPFDDKPTYAGQRITYTVKPLFGDSSDLDHTDRTGRCAVQIR
jgi:ligand-binding SRPBCC domain-containing protein